MSLLYTYVIAETTSELTVEKRHLMHQNHQATTAAAADDDDNDDNDMNYDDEEKVAEDDQQNDDPAMSVVRPRRITVNVGSVAVLDCDVEYPTADGLPQRFVQNIVTWRKQGVEAPVFIAFDGYPPRIDSSYLGRVRAVGPAAIEIDDVKTADEGWYECTVLFIDQDDESPGNGTWTYLAVNSMSAQHYTLSFYCTPPRRRRDT